MSRPPLELGSWGRIWVALAPGGRNGKPASFRARALYRDFDGLTREVAARGRTKSAAEARLLSKLRERASARHGGSLKSTDRFSVAAELWFEQWARWWRTAGGRPVRARPTVESWTTTSCRRWAEVRLGEITTPLVDSVIQSIKKRVGPPTAKSSRTVISGVLSLAVRHGAIATNPVRDVETIASRPKRHPRALDEDERRAWFAMLASDPRRSPRTCPT